MMNLISYCDGSRTLLEIANLIEEPFWDLMVIVEKLVDHELLEKNYTSSLLTASSLNYDCKILIVI